MRTGSWSCLALLVLSFAASAAKEASVPANKSPLRVIPPLSERPLEVSEGEAIATSGFRVRGVGEHPELGINPEKTQRLADGLFELASSGDTLSVEAALSRAGEKRAERSVGLTVGQLQKVAEQIAVYLRANGLPLAQAYVPVQEIAADGIVAIDVIEAKLGKIVVEDAKRMPPALIAASARTLKDAPLSRGSIESAMLKAQTLPGTAVTGTFRPGENPGETDLVLKVQSEETFEFRVGADNYGTEFAGEYRLRGDAIVHNPLGFGDQLTLTLVQAFEPSDTTFGSASYSVPVAIPELRAYVRAEKAAFVASSSLSSQLDVDGDNDLQELGLRWDMFRSRIFTASSGLAYQARNANVVFKNFDDDVPLRTLSDDSLRVTSVDVVMQRFDTRFKGVDFLDMALRVGKDRADGFEVIANDSKFKLVDLGYSRYQRLTDLQTLLLVTRLQYSDDTLSALERFSLGGPDSVRAYPVSEFLVDRGVLASLEYRVSAPGFAQKTSPFKGLPWGKVLQFMVFYDYAWGKLAKSDPGNEISGSGAGFLLSAPGNVTLKLTGATPTGSIDPSDGDDFRLYSELSIAF